MDEELHGALVKRGDLVERCGVKGTVTYVGPDGWMVVYNEAPGLGDDDWRGPGFSSGDDTPDAAGWRLDAVLLEGPDDLLTTTEAGEVLGCSAGSIVNWIRDGRLVSETTPGGHRRIRRSEVERFREVRADYARRVGEGA